MNIAVQRFVPRLFLDLPDTHMSILLSLLAIATLSLLFVTLFKEGLTKRTRILRRTPIQRTVRDQNDLVLVLGGAGYVGSSLVRTLLGAGRRVRVVDNLVYGDDAVRELRAHPNFEFRAGDCRKIQDMIAAMEGVDSIVHLAAIVGSLACEVNAHTALEVNSSATRMLIEVAKYNDVRRFIFASSCSVYDFTGGLIDENSFVEPVSLYTQSKLKSEHDLLIAASNSFHPVILRLAAGCGFSNRPRFDLIANLLTAMAYEEGSMTIFNGNQWRPFVHVQDIAAGIVNVLDAPLSVVSGEVFNLGDNRMNHTLRQLANEIRSFVPGVLIRHASTSDAQGYRVCFDKIRNKVGFSCAYTLGDAISSVCHALDRNVITDYTDFRYYNQKYLHRSQNRMSAS